ncbi:MAG: glycoside hydrolase family 32 protein [Cyclobacteriaceae bacterium]
MIRYRRHPTIIFGAFMLLSLHCTAQEKIELVHRYLWLPVDTKEEIQQLTIEDMRGTQLEKMNIRLARDSPEFWVTWDGLDHLNQKVALKSSKTNWSIRVKQSDERPGLDSLYQEKLRPQFHFSAQIGWLNDPNGLVYHNEEYHMFFQHNPYGWYHGNMHWGHAVSKDLLHWEELDIAITPIYNDWAFSGSAVIDKGNTAGFGENALVAAYTSTARGECLAYSLDNGRTFKEYDGNPVLKHSGRDPKVFWYAPGKHWVMVVFNADYYDASNGQSFKKRVLQIHTSTDLKNWEYQSEIPYMWECPELFELPIEDNPEQKKWIVYGGNAQYMIGTFDGKKFTPETSKLIFKEGAHYASQTYNNTPDGRRIMQAWGTIPAPGMPFNQMMLFPTELRLVNTIAGLRMLPKLIKEISLLHNNRQAWGGIQITRDKSLSTDVKSDVLHVIATFDGSDDLHFGLNINGYKLDYDNLSFLLDGVHMMPDNGEIKIEVLVDRTSIEIFGNDGKAYIVRPHISKNLNLEIYSNSPHWEAGTHTSLKKLEVFEMKSIWK